MSYIYVAVKLSPGKITKLKSKSAKECGTTITLKPAQMNTGEHKLSLTARKQRGVKLKFSRGAVTDIDKHGGMFPFIIPAIAALATGALSGAAGWGTKKLIDKVTGGTIKGKKKGKGLRLPGSRFTRVIPL